ncbi:MAG: hypothetical protein AB4062_13690 [Crocosphaera sp.]
MAIQKTPRKSVLDNIIRFFDVKFPPEPIIETSDNADSIKKKPEEREISLKKQEKIYLSYYLKSKTIAGNYFLKLFLSLVGIYLVGICIFFIIILIVTPDLSIKRDGNLNLWTFSLFIIAWFALILYGVTMVTYEIKCKSFLRYQKSRLESLKQELDQIRDEIEIEKDERLKDELLLPENRLKNLYEEYRLNSDLAGNIIFFDDNIRQKKVDELRKSIGETLEEVRDRIQNKSSNDETSDISNSQQLNEVQYKLGSLKGIIRREEKEQKEQENWKNINLIVILFYIALLSIILIHFQDNTDAKISLLRLPLWSLVWGGLGSLSAILFRFFTVKNRVKFSDEFKWLIARPIIGILMSSIAFLVTVSGLLVLSPNTNNEPQNISENSMRITSIICFLAGFSDKVYLGIIDLLITRLNFGEETGTPETKNEEKPTEKNKNIQ